jgi:hypothetical protein
MCIHHSGIAVASARRAVQVHDGRYACLGTNSSGKLYWGDWVGYDNRFAPRYSHLGQRVQRPSKPVCRRAARRRCDGKRIVFTADPASRVGLRNSPAVEVVSSGIYVMSGVAPGTYSFSITGSPLAGSKNAAPVMLTATLTVTSRGSGVWQK